jgi:oligosaccharide repeat unit polymerase
VEIATLFCLLICILAFLLKYKTFAWFHPGVWYLTLWTFCVSSLLIMKRYVQTVYLENHYRELFFFINWGAVCFVIVALCDARKFPNRADSKSWSINGFDRLFALFTILAFLFTVLYWYNSTAFSLDLGAVRDDYVDSLGDYRGVSIFENITSRFRMLTIPCSFYAGVILARWCADTRYRLSMRNLILILITILTSIMSALAIGGRRSIIGVFMYMAIGYAMCMVKQRCIDKHRSRTLLSVCIVLMILFGLFSTFVKQTREEYKGRYLVGTTDSATLNRFEGLLDYLSNVFWGYQFKTEYDPLPNESFGRNTFNGLCGFSVPLIQRVTGVPASLGALLGYSQINKIANFTKDYPFKTSLASVFYEMKSDFGFIGTLICTSLFIIITQYLYGWWIRKADFSFLSCYLLFEFYNYWGNCIFSGAFAAPTMVHILYMFVAIHVYIRYVAVKQKPRLVQCPVPQNLNP